MRFRRRSAHHSLADQFGPKYGRFGASRRLLHRLPEHRKRVGQSGRQSNNQPNNRNTAHRRLRGRLLPPLRGMAKQPKTQPRILAQQITETRQFHPTVVYWF